MRVLRIQAAIGGLFVAVGSWVFWQLVGRPDRFFDDADAIALRSLVAAMPFIAASVATLPRLLERMPREVDGLDPSRLARHSWAALAVVLVAWLLYFLNAYHTLMSPYPRTGLPVHFAGAAAASSLIAAIIIVVGWRPAESLRLDYAVVESYSEWMESSATWTRWGKAPKRLLFVFSLIAAVGFGGHHYGTNGPLDDMVHISLAALESTLVLGLARMGAGAIDRREGRLPPGALEP